MTGIILAGGKNSRMGRQKAFIEIEGKRIIDNTIAVFQEIFREVVIITNSPEEFKYTNLKLVKDIISDKGSLGGIYTGIKAARDDGCFIVACDMPYISKDLIKHITKIKGYDIVVPKLNGRYEPLFASYSKSCVNIIKEQLNNDNLKITELFSKVNVKEVCEDELVRYDDKLLSFINVNTPEELKRLYEGVNR